MKLRVGQGFDIHRFAPGRPLVLGGYTLPEQPMGLLGHSDADALGHAVIDAILGALALGDIGQWFPDNDPKWLGASAQTLLKHVLNDPRVSPWTIVNLDTTITTQKPKLAPHILNIRTSLAQMLGIPVDNVSVKAKTNEKLDDTGAGLALQANAVVLLSTT